MQDYRMSDSEQSSNLPAQIAAAVAGVPAALVPACVKALDRLIGAAVDIPVAWLEYQKAKIVSQTEAFRTIDGAITVKAAAKAGSNEQFADRALDNLVRKSYRQLDNKEAVSAAMLEDLRDNTAAQTEDAAVHPESASTPIDDDWLNVFERYAEDASSERMQKLWGRVLAGEVRKPGKYGMRTLRFLSEFSQTDALDFSSFCQNAFGGVSIKSLAEPDTDITNLLAMEAAGLIQSAGGMGLELTLTYNSVGKAFLVESPLAIMFTGEPGLSIKAQVISLTPLGQELVTLLPGRDARSAARVVGLAMKTNEIKCGYIMSIDASGAAKPMEILWQEQLPAAPTVNAN
jgi:hypothetical protein